MKAYLSVAADPSHLSRNAVTHYGTKSSDFFRIFVREIANHLRKQNRGEEAMWLEEFADKTWPDSDPPYAKKRLVEDVARDKGLEGSDVRKPMPTFVMPKAKQGPSGTGW